MRILLCDDHDLFRDGLKLILGQLSPDIELLDFADAESAIARIAIDDDIDLCLLDLDLPGMSGLEALQRLQEDHPVVPIVVLSASEAREDVRRALACGASGFIPKTTQGEVLLAAIQLVLSGGVYVPSLVMDSPNSPFSADSDGPKLSARQLEVLRLLAEGLSNSQIGAALEIAPGTVKTHIAKLYSLLKVDNRMAAAARLRELEDSR